MMAENKKKHNGQYRNPSGNDYGSTMKQFRAFDYNRLANSDQSGTNEAAYGASPFIIKHFGSPKAVPFVPKAKRGSEEHRVVEGETDEQKASRLQAKAEQLAQLAKDLVAKSKGAEKVKGFLSGKIAIKKAKELLSQKKTAKAERESRLPSGWSDEAARQSEQNALKAREEEEERKRMLAERRAKKREEEEKAAAKKREEEEKANAKSLTLPKWWDGVMCLLDYQRNSKDEEVRAAPWFGRLLKRARVEGDKSKKYFQSDSDLLRLAAHYAKWLFTVALPKKGYELVEYHPTESTYPPDEEMEVRSKGKGLYTFHKTGKFKPSRLMPKPIPDTITLLLHPDGKLAWEISSYEGDARWEGLAKNMVMKRFAGDNGLFFDYTFKKVGDKFFLINLDNDKAEGSEV